MVWMKRRALKVMWGLTMGFCVHQTYGQVYISEQQAIDLALENYPLIRSSTQKIEQQKSLLPSAYSFPGTEILIQAPTGEDMRASILQAIEFPSVYAAQRKAFEKQVSVAEAEKATNVNLVKYNVKTSFNNLLYAVEREKVLKRYDSILSDLIDVNDIRYRVGQIAILEKINGEAKYKLIQNQLLQAQTDRRNFQYQLSLYFGKPGDSTYYPNTKFAKTTVPVAINFSDTIMERNPIVSLYKNQIDYSKWALKVERRKRLPGLMGGYFNQASHSTPFNLRLNYGVVLPIAFWSYKSKIKAAQKGVDIAISQSDLVGNKLYSDFVQALSQYKQYAQSVVYFEGIGLTQSQQIIESAQKSFRSGAISYYIYLSNIDQAFQIELGFLEALKNYNQSVVNLLYIKGEL